MNVTPEGDTGAVTKAVGHQSLFSAPYAASHPAVETFHPIVAQWFDQRFPTGPTPPQEAAWPAIRTGADVLVASPTGSGKTLTGFMVAIDALWQAFDRGTFTPSVPKVLYVSPLTVSYTHLTLPTNREV